MATGHTRFNANAAGCPQLLTPALSDVLDYNAIIGDENFRLAKVMG
jgi:hypothetical protein